MAGLARPPGSEGRELVTLANSHHPLSTRLTQRATLAKSAPRAHVRDAVAPADTLPLRAAAISTLQINVGKRCNQACRHCHVDAGPDRREVMTTRDVDACLKFLDRATFQRSTSRAARRRCTLAFATSFGERGRRDVMSWTAAI